MGSITKEPVKAVTQDHLKTTGTGFGYTVPKSENDNYTTLLQKAHEAFETVNAMDDYQPTPDLSQTSRIDIHFPEKKDNPLGAWAYRFQCSHTHPTSSLLENRTVCLKDNIAMANVPCLLGTSTFEGWIPKTDATVVSRILEASGTITGKAVCENLSRGAVSNTAATGPVHNPYAHGYSVGGSSSGTAALVASGAVDMGLGCDQGGSIRIPASLCGLYGFKCTMGLVPYTGIASNDASVDSVGPMTKTLADCAVLLETIAGVDGLDDRQVAGTPFKKDVPKYTKLLEASKEMGVKGMKIGVLKEGLAPATLDPEVENKFREAVKVFEKLGADVEEVSVSIHQQARTVYSILSKMSNHMGMLGKSTGRRQVMLTDLFEKKDLPYTQEVLEKMPVMAKEGLFAGEYGWQHYPYAYAKSVNLTRKIKDAYDDALSKFDLLVMPTTVTAANSLPDVGADPVGQMGAVAGKLENTSPFNASGHPALAMPIGFVPAKEDPTLKLPASLQIVGRFWEETKILQAAYAWEREVKWEEC